MSENYLKDKAWAICEKMLAIPIAGDHSHSPKRRKIRDDELRKLEAHERMPVAEYCKQFMIRQSRSNRPWHTSNTRLFEW